MKEGLASYKFRNKNNWRKWAWNQIRDRVDTPSEEVILYLADEYDLDRPVALSKGFKHYNLIAINKDKEICETLRGQKKIAMHGDLVSLLLSWDKISTLQPTVVFADLCGTINTAIDVTIASLSMKYPPKVLVLNMIKGRETRGGFGSFFVRRMNKTVGKPIDRAVALLPILQGIIGEYFFGFSSLSKNWTKKECALVYNMMLEQMVPNWRAYKSVNGSVMNSIAFSIPTDLFIGTSEKHPLLNQYKYSNKLTRQISANLAIRTMRMNKTLK